MFTLLVHDPRLVIQFVMESIFTVSHLVVTSRQIQPTIGTAAEPSRLLNLHLTISTKLTCFIGQIMAQKAWSKYNCFSH